MLTDLTKKEHLNLKKLSLFLKILLTNEKNLDVLFYNFFKYILETSKPTFCIKNKEKKIKSVNNYLQRKMQDTL